MDETELPPNWQNLEHGQILNVTNAFLDLKVDGSVVRLFYMNQTEEVSKEYIPQLIICVNEISNKCFLLNFLLKIFLINFSEI